MAKGSEILLASNPKGHFEEGVGSGTLYPGMVVEPTTAALSNGRRTFQASSAAAGTHRGICVVLPDRLQGKLATDSYADGDHLFLYWPVAGEELNMLLGDVAGTADTVAIGDNFGVNNDGKLKADSSYNSRPFQAMEAHAALTADTLIWTKFMGPYA